MGRIADYVTIGVVLAYAVAVAATQWDHLDFMAWYWSAQWIHLGLNPYRGTQVGSTLSDANLNAPFSLLLFAPLAYLPPTVGLWLMRCVNVVAYAVLLWRLRRRFPAVFAARFRWALTFGGMWTCLVTGQVYMILACLAYLAWEYQSDRRLLPAAWCLGLVCAVKPNFLLWPVLICLAGEWIVGLSALAAAAGLSALPAIVLGSSVYSEWVDAVLSARNGIRNPENMSLIGAAQILGVPMVGVAAAVVFVLVAAGVIWHRRPAVGDLAPFALTASLLASPEALATYGVFLVPIFFRERWSSLLRFAAIVLTIPPPVAQFFVLHVPPLRMVGLVYVVALICVAIAVGGLGPASVDRTPVEDSSTRESSPFRLASGS
jgi:hypothetical protein